ncbi:beta-mannosidase-like [Malaya genurostris]|uniref:beta-mannosidase-like n=1 Tax=Malaya genurostris TaxID=325434 RepID=UPI0026F3FCB3|nr:beta-mannosidase-like [Malaya genurostris]XP_058443268.1 beta-mannosidase-like [Malaya genurostris]
MTKFTVYFITIISIQVIPLYSEKLDLNGPWYIENSNETIKLANVHLPSGIYTALEQASIIESIYDAKNDLSTRWIAKDNWTYSIDVPCDVLALSYTHVLLTLHGVDTFSNVYINEELLGETSNMFVRYRFDIKSSLQGKCPSPSILRVSLRSPVVEAAKLADEYAHLKVVPECPPETYNGECHVNMIRKMQASFSWDWGLAAPSMGIWKPVQIDYYRSVEIRDVTFSLTEEGGDWRILIGSYLETGISSKRIQGKISFELLELQTNSENKTIVIDKTSNENGEMFIEAILTIPKESVQLWWPNGHGPQILYSLCVKWEDQITTEDPASYKQESAVEKTVRIGFRSIELIQEPTYDGLLFYFLINGIPIFMKGSNWIPSSILPERSYDDDYVQYLLNAVHDTNMNMLRVWGGGVYESDFFYQLADELGILIWHDLMFACAMYPANDEFLINVANEVHQNVRRIQHHPSVALWATNNENEVALRQNWYGTAFDEEAYIQDYIKLYVNVVQLEIQKVDKWRTVLISSPSNGDRSTAEGHIAANPQDSRYGDVHYYNYITDGWDPSTYSGGRFISEYGYQSFPAFSSWPVQYHDTEELTDLIDHRQHSPLGNDPILVMIEMNLPMPTVNSTNYWRNLIYLSQISQAMIVKTETELYRCKRVEQGTMGALYWQLNDVWIAPSWSSIEYGGKYKILHYWMKQVFTENHVVGSINPMRMLDLYMIRDTLGIEENWTVSVDIYNWYSFTPVHSLVFESISVPENTVVKADPYGIYEYFNQLELDPKNHILMLQLHSHNGTKLSDNFVLLDKIKNTEHIPEPVVEITITTKECSLETNIVRYSLKVDVTSPVLFLYMDLKPEIHTLNRCHFSNNGFIQFTPSTVINLECLDDTCKSELKSTDIDVITINQYLHGNS